jgi:thiamine biosynthesis lipoprotein
MPINNYHILSGIKHTYYRITYNCPHNLNAEILLLYDTFYASLNPFDPQSTISKINNNEKTTLDSLFIEAFNRSKYLAKQTKGIFDPTCAPLINLWGFGVQQPDETSIDKIKEYIGYEKIAIENNTIVKQDSRVQLNFSAIGDGFACEIIARYLDQKEVKDYLIDIGGEIIAQGKNRTGAVWSIGIIRPPKKLGTIEPAQFAAILHFSQKTSLATSGNYNNFLTKNGKKIGHIINPSSGYPTDNNLLSATVIASDCITADAYATAIMAVEANQLDDLLQTDTSLEYYIIKKDRLGNYQVKQSKGMENYIQKNL